MKHTLPTTDSVQELAKFWDLHDATHFEGELVEVASPFAKRVDASVGVPLSEDERATVRRIAASRGVEEGALLYEWVKGKLYRRRSTQPRSHRRTTRST